MRSQFATGSKRNIRHLPFAFTEHGVAMLSSVLRSPKAIQVNIAIVRAFIKMRQALTAHKDLTLKVERLEGKVNLIETDVRFIREDVSRLRSLPEKPAPKLRGLKKNNGRQSFSSSFAGTKR